MVLSNFILSLFLISIYSHNVNCQLDLDTNFPGLNASVTYVYINSNSTLRLFPAASLTIPDFVADSASVTVSTESGLTQKPCFSQSNTPPCETQLTTTGLNINTALSLIQNIYYENSDPIDGRLVVVTVTVRYEVNVGDKTFETYNQIANVSEKRDKPIISFKHGYEYTPVYNHNFRPVQFLNEDNFTLMSLGGVYTSLLVCVFTQSELESISVDTDHPLVDSPVSINEIDRVCSRVSFNSIDNTTLLQVFSAFTYSETTEIIDNYNDRVISISVDADSNIGDLLYFNITYHISVIPTPIYIQTLPVVYYEDVGTQVYVPDLSSVKLSDVINVSRQSLTDLKPITSLLFQSDSAHIPKVNLWNDQMCSSSWLTHPVHKFEFCTDEQFFFNLELTSAFQLKFSPTSETIMVDGRELVIYNATEPPMYGFITLVGSATQNPEANHFSIWFKNAPGKLTGCPLEITNGNQVDYQICLSGSDSTIEFWYSGLAPEHREVRVTYSTEGAFRLDDWNYVSVSVTTDSIHLLLNELELTPSEFYWFDNDSVDNFTQIPVHLYSTSRTSITNIYILGKNSGFIGEVTGVIVDQFFISTREAYCMFSCIEGFYMNETIIDNLIEWGLQINFVRESFEVMGNMSVNDVTYILQNLYYNTPVNSSNTYRPISTTVSDDLFTSTEVTRISFLCSPDSCYDNSYCYANESADICLCEEGYLDASAEGNMSVCKHPMDCSYMNGGCSELETCLQVGNGVRECEDVCDSSPCLNGGTCNITSVSEYECDCIGEFYGFDCECRNSCLVQDCSPGSCIDYCNGSFVCVAPSSSYVPIPTSSLLSTASQVMTSSFDSSQIYSQLTSSLLQTSSVVPPSSLAVSSSFVRRYYTPVSSYSMTSSFSSSQLSSSLLLTSSLVPSSTQSVSSSSSDLPESSTHVTSDITSSLAASSYLAVSSSILSESSTPVSYLMTPSYFSSQSSSLIQSSSFVTSSIPVSSYALPESSAAVSSYVMASIFSSSQLSSSLLQTSSLLPSSSLPASSSVTDIVTSSSIPTSSQIESSSVTGLVTSSQIPPSSALSQGTSSSSSLHIVITSSQVPSSSVVAMTTSSEIPSSSVFSVSMLASSSIDVITSSQLASSSIDVITSSQLPSSSSDVITSSQLASSSSDVITSSQIPSSSSDAITSSQIPSSSIDIITSSQLASSSIDIITSSQLPSSSSDVITSSQLPSSSIDIITSSQLPSSSSDAITSSQLPSSSSDVITSSQLPSSSSDFISSSQIPYSSTADVVMSSQLIQSSSPPFSQILSSSTAMTSSQTQFSSSDVNPVTSSGTLPTSSQDIQSSSSDILTSMSSEPIPTSPVVSVVSTSVTSSSVIESSVESSTDITPISSSIYPSPTVIESTTDSHSTISVQPMQSSSSSLIIMDTSSTENVFSTPVPTNPPTIPPEITPANSVQIAVGIGVGIFVLILVIIFTIALIIALFLHRMSRHQDLDPTKEFDHPHSTCPAEITAVFKNKETSIIN